jgi:hypothetical protein
MSMPQYCAPCRFVMEDQQLCPYCHAEGRRLNSLYCPPCGIRIYQPRCPQCDAEGVHPMLNSHKKELFFTIIREFQVDSPVPEAAMHLLRLLHSAGIYNEHRESIEACLSVMEESQELIPLASYKVMPLIVYLAMEYCDNSAEWLNLRANY